MDCFKFNIDRPYCDNLRSSNDGCVAVYAKHAQQVSIFILVLRLRLVFRTELVYSLSIFLPPRFLILVSQSLKMGINLLLLQDICRIWASSAHVRLSNG